jgi:hypothetical protein
VSVPEFSDTFDTFCLCSSKTSGEFLSTGTELFEFVSVIRGVTVEFFAELRNCYHLLSTPRLV